MFKLVRTVREIETYMVKAKTEQEAIEIVESGEVNPIKTHTVETIVESVEKLKDRK